MINTSHASDAPLRRTLHTLQRIGPRPALLVRYIGHRGLQDTRRRRLRRTYATHVAHVPPGARVRPWPIDLPRRDELPAPLQAEAVRLVSEAEDVLAGIVDILGSGPSAIGPEIDWHRDFKSGYRWPEKFFMDVVVTRLTDDSDAKVPWDLSRSHHLLALARAQRLTGDDRFGREVERQLASWLDANPPGVGINWVQPMEIAIRAVNWIWTLRTLESAFELDAGLRARVIASLQSHGRHVAATLEGTPLLRSNHYLANVLGLLVLGAAIEGDPAAARWYRTGRRAFEREIRSQVLADGMSFESSVGYHGLVLEMFLLARLAATWRGQPFSRAYDDRLARMLVASRALRHPDGRVPLIGDVDSGRILPASFARPASHDPQLSLGAAMLGLARPFDGPPDPEVAWTLGVGAWQQVEARAVDDRPATVAFPAAGVYVLERQGLRAVVRCGGVGQNGNGGHAHNDIGSYELYVGVPVVVDPGNYAYTFDPVERNAFRSVEAHNTVSVDGEEPNPFPPDLFRLPQQATPRVLSWDPGTPTLLVDHDGYRRLPGEPRHERRLTVDPGGQSLVVEDRITGTGFHEVRCYVHLGHDVEAAKTGEHTVSLTTAAGEMQLKFDGDLAVELRAGWVAPEYGRRDPAQVVVACWSGTLPTEFAHRVVRGPAGGGRG